jgi:1-acyl-sn-glycerol-3-phosphate acyltransferase
MIVVLPFVILPYIFGEKTGGAIAYFFLKVWAYLFSWSSFIRVRVHKRHYLKETRARIIICNHTSFLDAPAYAIAMKGQCRPLGKVEMTKFPIFGWIYRMNVIMVDRTSSESRSKSFENLKKAIARNISILIFPEGTMNRGDVILQPFYNGAFRLACELKVPIQPLVMENAINLMPRSGPFTIKPGVVDATYLEEVSPEGHTEESLRDFCHNQMLTFLNRKKS